MKNRLNTAMDQAWDFIWNKLYYPETGLFYDFLTDHPTDPLCGYLPKPEEIAIQFPNPCGWGTGMEDSMLNAGSILAMVTDRWQVTGDSAMSEYIDKVLKGIELCLTVPENRGFLARSVCPFDKKSYYTNSSRDQYTHVVYGLWYFLKSKLGTPEQNALCSRLLVDMATYAEKTVVEENYYTILNDNGKQGQVQIMWANPIPPDPVPGTQSYWPIEPHEVLRLPMMHAAAWYATGDEHWRDMMLKYMDEGIAHAMKVPGNLFGYCLIQMQLSQHLLYEVEPDETRRKKLAEVMTVTAKQGVAGMNKTMAYLQKLKGYTNMCGEDWRKCSFRFQEGHLCGGDPFMMPQHADGFAETDLGVRGFGEKIYIQIITPEYELNRELLRRFVSYCRNFDYENHCVYGPIYHLMAYWAMRAQGISDEELEQF